MDLLSITASLAGVTVPTLKCVQHLRNVLDRIINAPSDIVLVRQDLLIIEQAIISVQNISDQQWESLGKTIVSQLKTGLNLCKESSSKFQAEIDRWTIHSDDGKLCFRDRAMIGLFRQDQIKSISAQLQNCKTTLTLVVSTAILYSSLQQTKEAERITEMISTKETEITTAISTAKYQLEEVNDKLDELYLVAQDEDEKYPDQESATYKVIREKRALQRSLELLQELPKGTHAVAVNTQKDQGHVVYTTTFGDYNHGVQAGVNNATINFSIGGFPNVPRKE